MSLGGWLKRMLLSWGVVAAAGVAAGFMSGMNYPAQAETRNVVIERFITDPPAVGNLISQTELLIRRTITNQFAQNPEISQVRVVVLGNYRGETMPVLTTVVSRSQWQTTPQVPAWTRYSGSSAILFARLDSDEEGANRRSPTPASRRPNLSTTVDPAVQVEEAFSEGRLTADEYQRLIDALD